MNICMFLAWNKDFSMCLRIFPNKSIFGWLIYWNFLVPWIDPDSKWNLKLEKICVQTYLTNGFARGQKWEVRLECIVQPMNLINQTSILIFCGSNFNQSAFRAKNIVGWRKIFWVIQPDKIEVEPFLGAVCVKCTYLESIIWNRTANFSNNN